MENYSGVVEWSSGPFRYNTIYQCVAEKSPQGLRTDYSCAAYSYGSGFLTQCSTIEHATVGKTNCSTHGVNATWFGSENSSINQGLTNLIETKKLGR